MSTYQPRYRVTGSTNWINFGSPLSTFSVTVTGLAANTQYDFDILEIDSFGSTPSATVSATTPSGIAESAEGTLITHSNLTTQVIYDANLLQWSMTGGFQVATSPSPYSTKTTDATTSNVTEIEYHNHTVFYENSTNQWFYWSGSAWTSTLDITGPILVGGIASPTFTVGASGQSVGTVTVTTVGVPAFSGIFAVSGTDAAFFTMSGNSLVTAATTTARTYSISITATQANVIGSPLTTAFSISGVTQAESVEGFTVTTAGPIVYASETMGAADPSGPWNQFSLVADSGSPPFSIVESGGGTAGTGGGNVVALVYHNHTLWQHATDNSTFNEWWYWNTTSAAYIAFNVSSVSLSGSTVAASSPVNTVVGAITVAMSDNSTFSGTYTVSDTTHFKIVGTNLETAVANLSGSYPITITVTPNVVGNAFTTTTITITAGTSSFASPPAQAVAGFTTMAFFDDFTTNTITGNGGFSTMQSGIKWYPGANIATNVDPTNYHLMTSATAASFGNGSNGAGPNASPNGGIVQIFGNSANSNQSTSIDKPQNDLSTTDGAFGPTGYWEAYVQTNNQAQDHMGWWTLPVGWANSTEIDTLETGPAWNGKWGQCDLNEWVGGSNVHYLTQETVAYDANWHTFGMLIKYNSGSTTVGTVSSYLDNVLVNTQAIGAGTTWAQALLYTRYMLMGKDYAAGRSINFDWVRVWQ